MPLSKTCCNRGHDESSIQLLPFTWVLSTGQVEGMLDEHLANSWGQEFHCGR